MKKNLLLIASLAVAFGAAAQGTVEGIWFDKEKAMAAVTGPSEKKDIGIIPGGTIVSSDGEAATWAIAYEDEWGTGGVDASGYNSARINGVDLGKIPGGIAGNSNPQGWSLTTAATSGAVFKINVKKDGYLTIFSKYNTGKNYWVFEGNAGEGEMCMAYTFGAQVNKFEGVDRIEFSLPATEEGYFTADLDPDMKYCDGTAIRWPEKIAFGTENADVKDGSCFGVIMFPVFAEAETYIFGAQGSKVTCPGVVFTSEKPVVTIYGTEKVAEDGTVTPAPEKMTFTYPGASSEGGESGIENIITDNADENAPIYNVMGIQVDENYKGLVIKNGKKFVNR